MKSKSWMKLSAAAVAALSVTGGALMAQEATETPADPAAEVAVETKTWLGVAVIEQDDQLVIARVRSGSPAEAADLQVGDVIVSFGGEAVTTAAQLSDLVEAAAAGDVVTLEVLREDETVSVEATLTEVTGRGGRGGWGGMGRGPFGGLDGEWDALTAAEHLLHADLTETDAGYEVADVLATQNPFTLEEGDVVTTVNGQAVAELDFTVLVEELAAMDTPQFTLEVVRGGDTITVTADAPMGRGGRGFGGGHDGQGGRGPGGRGGNGRPGFPFTDGSDDPASTEEAPSSGSL